MAATVDFASLSLQDALDLAIIVEEEAQERYLEFVDQMEQHHTPEAARFFAAMAKNEQKHGEELRDLRWSGATDWSRICCSFSTRHFSRGDDRRDCYVARGV